MDNNTRQYRSVTPPPDDKKSHPLIKMVTSIEGNIPQSRKVKTYSIKDGSTTHLQLLLNHHANKIQIDRNELVFLTRSKNYIRDMSGVDMYSVRDTWSGLELLSHLGLDNTLYCYKRCDLGQELWFVNYSRDMSEIESTYDYAIELLQERQEREYLAPSNKRGEYIQYSVPYVHKSQVYAFMRTAEFANSMNEVNGEGYSYTDWVDRIVHRHPHWRELLKGTMAEGGDGTNSTYNLDPHFNLGLREKEEDEGTTDEHDVGDAIK